MDAEHERPRWVLITGAAARLGRELALAFAQAGWSAVVHHRHSHAAAEQLVAQLHAMGGQALAVQADLADAHRTDRLLDELPDDVGTHLYALINNASEFTPDTGWDEGRERLQRLLDVNLLAPLSLTQQLARRIRARGQPHPWACAVHILDQKVHNLNPDYYSYTLTKLALERAVGLQAQALAPWLRVCGVSPGLCYVSGPQTEDNFERARRVNLLRQPLQPAAVAAAVVHMVHNPALTGCVLPVDNGQHRLGLARDVMFAVDLGLAP
ncbi:NAD(P)-dependent dehydrogenase (short-subunit alcohol dehydrogenase family) [Tepidimonas ignava]|uniref:3-oxoacyl-acyl-carrier-protein reductase n=1 Tax=Tepidimonas ignava TaxID=114249 RepID=A0A4V2UVX4_9BURK|nr:SDR family NAD(P)-dependent oxidoreductase [Tepidimonas ignava]TCS97487.1 NAD(P)-dependent dehydrogenase (short-subunit alcohol dehydrogenase family) [Tepidimonas ignava]TSE22120.1 3-oxoacyl-acyl-carrier-protein reductase [Tepidimonas ignava]